MTNIISLDENDIFPHIAQFWRSHPPSETFERHAYSLICTLEERRMQGELVNGPKEQHLPKTQKSSEPDDDTPLQVHAATFSTPDTSNYSLCRPFILDTGSNVHVCNDRSRFQDLTPSQDTLYFPPDLQEVPGHPVSLGW
ncbi:hypothetical protein VTN31DRAFT_4901 [Thermomyces dupontii]|uniref:uncharacterized protein n=1 Tax=Talaromyces thermophilus TaxID=28565 RepID=UPI003742CC9F